MIRKAFERDLEQVEKGYIDLLVYEKKHGSNSSWILGVYPTMETAEKAFSEGSLYVLEDDEGVICASIILNEHQLEDYKKISWEYEAEDSKVKVVHTLCIPPQFSRRGYGRQMMEYAENKATEEGFEVLRIDTCDDNEPAKRLYYELGFRCAGRLNTLFMGRIPEEQIFLEKKIKI